MGTKTFLDSINAILKRVGVISGDAAAFTSSVDAEQQHYIDICKQVIPEGIDELYTSSPVSMPSEQKEGSITLVTGSREYTLPSDLVTILWPLIDRTNTMFIFQYPGDYNDMLLLDPEQNDTGLPSFAKISPVNGKLHMDRAVDSAYNGRIYTMQYEKDVAPVNDSDTLPFADEVWRAMVPAWVQLYKREMKAEFDQALYKMSVGRASRLLSEEEPRPSYFPR